MPSQHLDPRVVEELKAKGLLKEEDGRQIITVKGVKGIALTVIKSDGGYTYDTTDLAAIRYRLVDLNMDCVYYVVGVAQALHFKLIFKVAELMGWLKPHQHVEHIGFGDVQSEEKGDDGKTHRSKFKTRSGDTVKLEDLLDEGIVKAREKGIGVVKKLEHKGKELEFSDEEKKKIILRVAYGAIKYSDLSTTRTNNYVFSYDRMLAMDGNTAVYLLYSYVRISSILRNANAHFNKAQSLVDDFSITPHSDKTKVEHEKEANLCKYLLTFPEVIDKVSKDLQFHTICNYMYTLSKLFTSFFLKCRCIYYKDQNDKSGEIDEVKYSRLLICEATRKIMKQCFDILNIPVLERM